MQDIQGKHFSITDPKGINTVIYEVYETKKEYVDINNDGAFDGKEVK